MVVVLELQTLVVCHLLFVLDFIDLFRWSTCCQSGYDDFINRGCFEMVTKYMLHMLRGYVKVVQQDELSKNLNLLWNMSFFFFFFFFFFLL